jgi:hypothetical protein
MVRACMCNVHITVLGYCEMTNGLDFSLTAWSLIKEITNTEDKAARDTSLAV